MQTWCKFRRCLFPSSGYRGQHCNEVSPPSPRVTGKSDSECPGPAGASPIALVGTCAVSTPLRCAANDRITELALRPPNPLVTNDADRSSSSSGLSREFTTLPMRLMVPTGVSVTEEPSSGNVHAKPMGGSMAVGAAIPCWNSREGKEPLPMELLEDTLNEHLSDPDIDNLLPPLPRTRPEQPATQPDPQRGAENVAIKMAEIEGGSTAKEGPLMKPELRTRSYRKSRSSNGGTGVGDALEASALRHKAHCDTNAGTLSSRPTTTGNESATSHQSAWSFTWRDEWTPGHEQPDSPWPPQSSHKTKMAPLSPPPLLPGLPPQLPSGVGNATATRIPSAWRGAGATSGAEGDNDREAVLRRMSENFNVRIATPPNLGSSYAPGGSATCHSRQTAPEVLRIEPDPAGDKNMEGKSFTEFAQKTNFSELALAFAVLDDGI